MLKNEPIQDNPWLRRFAALTAVVTFLLLGLGGLVTSHNAGMSVPDWPNSYGYNMFFFPIKDWVGGIFYEHTHRLLASGVGLLTTILAVWLWVKEPRRWMRWLGVTALLGVVAQGVLGGLRVVLLNAHLGIIHAIVGQLFFVLMAAIALFTSRFWQNLQTVQAVGSPSALDTGGTVHPAGTNLRRLVLFTTLLIFGQLIIGATMRQAHAGLAIPDFPLAYGKLWPDTSAAAVAGYNEHRISAIAENPITAFQIILQMAHRITAVLILLAVAGCAWMAHRPHPRKSGSGPELECRLYRRLSLFWLALILAQIALGAWTTWSNKAADVATLHVLGGALSLATGAMWCLIAFRRTAMAAVRDLGPEEPRAADAAPIGAHPALAANK